MSKSAQQTVIYVLVRSALTESYYNRLWIASRNLSQSLARRHWLDELAGSLYAFRGDIIYPTGESFSMPCIDRVFGDDPDMRWLSLYLEANETGAAPRRIIRKFERLVLIDLFFKIRYPKIARHFGR